METGAAFDIGINGYTVHRLGLEDATALQRLFEKCADYMLLVDGHPAGPNSAESEFDSRPPGKPIEDKFLFGIINPHNDLLGELDVMRAYPDDSTWWIGLLLIEPSARSLGLGEKVVEGFVRYVQAHGGQAIMLGVVAKNEKAYRFWTRMGFELVLEREPQTFGEKTHIVRVMRRSLIEQVDG